MPRPVPRPVSRPDHAVVFDLDGTLIDSRADLATAVNQMRRDRGLEALSLEEVVAQVGRGARDLVRRCLPVGLEGAVFEAAFASFRAHYAAGCLVETELYPGLSELLAKLAAERPLAVLTNKPEAVSRAILAGLGLLDLFREVVGGDTLSARKPDPVGLGHLAERLGQPLSTLTLVGDSAIDEATARAAGCRFVFVEWGFASGEERAAIHADARVATAAELAEVLR